MSFPQRNLHIPEKERTVGHQWEIDFFGCCSDEFTRPPKVSWNRAYGNVLAAQPELRWDPRAPATPIAKELFECIKSFLPREDAEMLMLYSCIGTVMDFTYGTDGMFLVGKYYVGIDLTTCDVAPGEQIPGKTMPRDVIAVSSMYSGAKLWRVALCIAQKFEEIQTRR